MKIAVLSDTHGLLRPEVLKLVRRCDAAIHAGDVDRREIVDRLTEVLPLYLVRGNNDGEWARELPTTLRFKLEEINFYLIHNRKDIPQDLSGIDVVIFGHSHKYEREEKEGRLWLNPGSCGKRRFDLPLTMALLTIEAGVCRTERVEFTPQGPAGRRMARDGGSAH